MEKPQILPLVGQLQACKDPDILAYVAFDIKDNPFLLIEIEELPDDWEYVSLILWGYAQDHTVVPPTIARNKGICLYDDLLFYSDGNPAIPTYTHKTWFWAFRGRVQGLE